jgi:hypothetical protein
MKIALINDTHHDCRGGNQSIAANQAKFWSKVFWPYLDKNDIRHIIHLGDIVDDRRTIDIRSLEALNNDLIMPAAERGCGFDVILGNHDVYFKSTNKLNIMQSAYADSEYHKSGKLKWFSEPAEVIRGGLKMLFVPWICKDTEDLTTRLVRGTDAVVALGHFEFHGFDMYRGTPAHGGYDAKEYEKFESVFSGHYHHKSTRGNIHYLGAQFEMTWSDAGDSRGFHVFDTETRELTYVLNTYTLFKKVFYDDAGIKNFDDLIEAIACDGDAPADFEGSYVKLIVKNKTNPYFLDRFVDYLEKSGVSDLQIVEDHLNLDVQAEEEIVDETENTITIIQKFASQLADNNENVNVNALNELLADIYREAATIEDNA